MKQMRKIFLARNNKTYFHSLFEVIPSGCGGERYGTLPIDLANDLLQWKNVDELIAVTDKAGALIPSDVYKGTGRLIGIQDAIEIAEAGGRGRGSQGYCACDDTFLHMQLYLDGNTGFYPSKASIARGIARHGLIESDAAKDLRAWAEEDPGATVAVEPISDLCYARNLCSIVLRIIANYQNMDVDNVLEASGFRHVRINRKIWTPAGYRDTYYAIPFHHNTLDDTTINFTWKWGSNIFAYTVIDPLRNLIRETKPKDAKHGLGSIESATEITSSTITGAGRPLLNFNFDYEREDTRLYLAICDDLPQREAAKRFVVGLGEMVRELNSRPGAPLGWDFSQFPDLMGNESPRPVFHTLFSAMVGTLLYREGLVPATCKNCGNAFFNKPKGKKREFCSNTCRTVFSKSGGAANPSGEENGRRAQTGNGRDND